METKQHPETSNHDLTYTQSRHDHNQAAVREVKQSDINSSTIMPSSTEYNEKRILQEPPNNENDEHDDDLGNYIKSKSAKNNIE